MKPYFFTFTAPTTQQGPGGKTCRRCGGEWWPEDEDDNSFKACPPCRFIEAPEPKEGGK